VSAKLSPAQGLYRPGLGSGGYDVGEALAAVAAVLVSAGEPEAVVKSIVALLGAEVAGDQAAVEARLAAEPALVEQLRLLVTISSGMSDEAASAIDGAWADWYTSQEDWTAGLARADRALRRTPDDAAANWRAASCLAELGRRRWSVCGESRSWSRMSPTPRPHARNWRPRSKTTTWPVP
jgi:hypothetical protein